MFELDPIAEYLAALYLVERNGGTRREWDQFLKKADVVNRNCSIRGCLVAVQDCCAATDKESLLGVIRDIGLRIDGPVRQQEANAGVSA